MFGTVQAFLLAATEAFKAFQVFSADFKELVAAYKKHQEAQFMEDSNKAFKPLQGSTTPSEKDKAAKDIAGLDRHL
jgi:hypothetical protein